MIQKNNEELVSEIKKQKVMEEERIKRERELNQAHKMEAIGTLAAGIAHEINTPIQFISDNMEFIKMTADSLLQLIKLYEILVEDYPSQKANSVIKDIRITKETIGFSFLKEEISTAIQQSQEGLERVARIVRAMKDFSHVGIEDEKEEADINHAVETTLVISRNEWKYVADLKTDLDPALPLVPCFIGDIKQVILNLLINAAHAIDDVLDESSADKGLITVATLKEGDSVVISVSDTGSGIEENIRERVFDHFFTTKEVGKGTGQGLSMAYGTIVEKHKGIINFESEVGKGTTFYVKLPLSVKT